MAKPYVAVVGNICAGKTTFVNRFASRYNDWRGLPEILDEGKVKASNESDSAFLQATFFFNYYVNHHLLSRSIAGPVIQESCIESSSLFPEIYQELGYFSSDKSNALKEKYSVFLLTLPRPDFYIYLHAPLEILLTRAEKRDEPLRTFSRRLIPKMQIKLESWIKNHVDPSSIFRIDTSKLNFIERSSIFDEIQSTFRIL